MTVKKQTVLELRELLQRIANPKSVFITPDLSNPDYKYHLLSDDTYESEKRKRLSGGELN
jgi:hypothetical protein